ncbi:alpha/beta hydrolase [Aeromicrobium sp. UC242_57]|uniref:alpha/beta hydrolase n=1 Tax=Aeromicrobium sp. UC242_57 TaxID=3374624 RepID=UPI0037B74898
MTTLAIDDRHTIRSGADDDPLVVLLHGYGANEQDLPGLMPHLHPGLAAASVRAPLTLGPGSFAWVPIQVPGRPDPSATADATAAMLAWFDEFVAPERPVVLLGFSQGGLMVSQLAAAPPPTGSWRGSCCPASCSTLPCRVTRHSPRARCRCSSAR